MPSPLHDNLAALQGRIDGAARAAGRRGEEVRLVAVTKAVGVELARELVELGVRDLGENRVDELERKAAALSAAPDRGEESAAPIWHFIGHLQRNKARRVLRLAAWIHSVDGPRLLDALERIAGEEGARPRILLQLHLSGDESKHGMDVDQFAELLPRCGELRHLRLAGLMAMGPREDVDGQGATRVFERLAGLAREIEADPERAKYFEGGRVHLSMGMSGDFERAVGAGSTLVRVGSALYSGIDRDYGSRRETA